MNLISIFKKFIIYYYTRAKFIFRIHGIKRIFILNSNDTINLIVKSKCSVTRFGDGELMFIDNYLNNCNHSSKFQIYNTELGKNLYKILKNEISNEKLLICLPSPLFNKYTYQYKRKSLLFWSGVGINLLNKIHCILYPGNTYGDSTFTRFYITRKNINLNKYINKLKQIWNNRNILLIEGRYSRLGVGNDLFSNAISIRRILCPETNAFNCYDRIYNITLLNIKSPDDLVIIALGMTATVLAADLSKKVQAIDIGHIDIEYEWFLKKSKFKEPIKHKFTNEADFNLELENFHDQIYNSQIIEII